MRLVPLEAFRDRIPFAVAVNAVERGFRALALGEAVLPDPMVVELKAGPNWGQMDGLSARAA